MTNPLTKEMFEVAVVPVKELTPEERCNSAIMTIRLFREQVQRQPDTFVPPPRKRLNNGAKRITLNMLDALQKLLEGKPQ